MSLFMTRQRMLKAGGLAENVNVVVANLTDSHAQDRIIQSTLDKLPKFDVNNAGANVVDGTMNTDQSMDLYHKTFQINLQAVVEMIKKCKEHLRETKGEIMSSIAAGS